MRTSVAAHAADLGVQGYRLNGFVLAVTELATNAIRHGAGAGDLTLWQQATKLYCRVTNRRPARALTIPQQRPPLHTVDGRGLWLVKQFCDQIMVRLGNPTAVTIAVHLQL